MDKTIKETFIIQEREMGNEITENPQNLPERSQGLVQLPAEPKVVYTNVNMAKDFSSRPWNRQDFSK